jgi:hypothetical protein
MKVKIIFTSDFADKKKGDEFECNGMLASQLINNDKVAKMAGEAENKKEVVLEAKPKTKKK